MADLYIVWRNPRPKPVVVMAGSLRRGWRTDRKSLQFQQHLFSYSNQTNNGDFYTKTGDVPRAQCHGRELPHAPYNHDCSDVTVRPHSIAMAEMLQCTNVSWARAVFMEIQSKLVNKVTCQNLLSNLAIALVNYCSDVKGQDTVVVGPDPRDLIDSNHNMLCVPSSVLTRLDSKRVFPEWPVATEWECSSHPLSCTSVGNLYEKRSEYVQQRPGSTPME